MYVKCNFLIDLGTIKKNLRENKYISILLFQSTIVSRVKLNIRE